MVLDFIILKDKKKYNEIVEVLYIYNSQYLY